MYHYPTVCGAPFFIITGIDQTTTQASAEKQRNALLTESDQTLGHAGFFRVYVRSMWITIRLDLRNIAMQKMFSRSLCVS